MSDEGQSLTTNRFGREFQVVCSDGIALVDLYEKRVAELEGELSEVKSHRDGVIFQRDSVRKNVAELQAHHDRATKELTLQRLSVESGHVAKIEMMRQRDEMAAQLDRATKQRLDDGEALRAKIGELEKVVWDLEQERKGQPSPRSMESAPRDEFVTLCFMGEWSEPDGFAPGWKMDFGVTLHPNAPCGWIPATEPTTTDEQVKS